MHFKVELSKDNFIRLENNCLTIKTNRNEEFVIANEILKNHDTIESLILSGCTIDEKMVEKIGGQKTSLWRSIKCVDIRSCTLLPGVLDNFCKNLWWAKNLSSFKITESTPPDTLEPIINLLRNTRIEEIVLRRLSLDNEEIIPLVAFLQNISAAKSVKIFDLSENEIRNYGATILSRVILKNRFIRRIYLTANIIDHCGASNLISVAKHSNTLELLDLRGIEIDKLLEDEALQSSEMGGPTILIGPHFIVIEESENSEESEDCYIVQVKPPTNFTRDVVDKTEEPHPIPRDIYIPEAKRPRISLPPEKSSLQTKSSANATAVGVSKVEALRMKKTEEPHPNLERTVAHPKIGELLS